MSATDKKKILGKLLAVRKDVEYMQKEGRNSAQGYNFLGEAQITAQFKELFDKHGIIFWYESKINDVRANASGKQILTGVEVSYQFIDAESGEFIGGTAAGQGTDGNDKGVYKAITGAIKYIFMKSFLIPTGDDPENDTREEKTKAKKKEQADYGSTPTERNDVPFGGKDEDED